MDHERHFDARRMQIVAVQPVIAVRPGVAPLAELFPVVGCQHYDGVLQQAAAGHVAEHLADVVVGVRNL